MSGADLLPARARRTRECAPTLDKVVEALIDGDAVEWDAAERHARTPAEQQMTRELRALAQLTRPSAGVDGGGAGRLPRRRVLERTLDGLAAAQVMAALAIAVLVEWPGAAWGLRLACMAVTLVLASGLLRRGRVSEPSRLTGHLLLLVAAAQARPFLDLSTGAGAPRWLQTAGLVLFAEAFLPVATWRLATAYPPVVRCSSFERLSAALLALALACSIGTAAAWGLGVLGMPVSGAVTAPRLALLVALGWGGAAAVVTAVRRHGLTRRPQAHAHPAARARWQPAVMSWLTGVAGTLRGTPAARLADLGADLQRARSPREVATALASHVGAALGTRTVAILAPGGPGWTTVAGCLPTLRCDCAVAALLDSADEAVGVGRRAKVYHLLPPADREWLALARISTIVRLASRNGDTLAGLLVGSSPGTRTHDRRDRAFLTAAARAAALALDAITRPSGLTSSVVADEDLAHECPCCGEVSVSADLCACGGVRHLAALPACLHETFRVERRIGRGGMGVVYLARDLRLDRPVALKTLPSLSSSRVGTLRAEARAMATLAHPSVAVLYGLEQWRGTPVLVAEYLAGGTLAERLAAGPVPVSEAVCLGASVADALAVLHARGWLHRDVKPSNIGFCEDGTPKLLDFGLTRLHAGENESWTPLAGTPLYLSPELLDGEPAQARDDVWALALVVVEMITGVHPLHAVGSGAARQPWPQHPAAVDLSTGAAALPPGLTEVLGNALHPSLSQRHVDARALAAALRAAGTAA